MIMMNKFKILHDIILKNEGFYSNNPNDLGGRTYCGISEKNFPDWPGWDIIDKYEPLKYNQEINDPYLIEQVERFYYIYFYNPMRVGDLNDVAIAAQYYDCGINCGIRPAVKMLQSSVNECIGSDLKVDGVIGPRTINAVNSIDPNDMLLDIYIKMRMDYYIEIGRENPSQRRFLDGWINRIGHTCDLALSIK